MAYDLDFDKEKDLKYHVKKFFLHPPRWIDEEYALEIDLDWKFVKFDPENRVHVPKFPGVYCFVVKPQYKFMNSLSYLFYIGKTNRTLHKRYKEYLNDQKGKGKPRHRIFKMLNIYKKDIFFGYAQIDDALQVGSCEDKLINTFVPHINTVIPEAKISHELKDLYQ